MRRGLTLAFILLVPSSWLLGWSPYLRAETIKVVGNAVVSSQEIVKASGITIDQPLARINGARVERGLTSISRIESVRVVRQWPREVTLRVKERKAAALLNGQGVDESGTIFALAPKEKTPKVRITAADPSQRDVVKWFAIYKQLPKTLQTTIEAVDLSDMESITFTTADRKIVWGSADETPTKIKVLATLSSGPWRVIDLSAPLAPTTSK